MIAKRLCTGFLMLSLAAAAYAEQLTTIAIVDIGRVYTSFFRESQSVRDLERQKQAVQEELNKHAADLRKLFDQRTNLAAQGASAELARLDKQIYDLQQFVNEYRKLKLTQIQDEERKLAQSDAFLLEITAAIKFVSESEGYSIVLDRENPYMRWWSPDVDITDKVLDRLKKSVAR